MCKGYGSSLAGPALQWYTSLLNSSIGCFVNLHSVFLEQFTSSRRVEKHSNKLYTIKQRDSKSLRAFVAFDPTKKKFSFLDVTWIPRSLSSAKVFEVTQIYTKS